MSFSASSWVRCSRVRPMAAFVGRPPRFLAGFSVAFVMVGLASRQLFQNVPFDITNTLLERAFTGRSISHNPLFCIEKVGTFFAE